MNPLNAIDRFRKPMTKHVAGISASPLDDEWLGITKDRYTNERNPLRYDLNPSSRFGNQKFSGPETSIRFNKNDYHGTWTTPNARAAGYVSQSNSKSLDFLERGTSSLIESNGEDQSVFVEDLLFTILTRFSDARRSLYKSIRISDASRSGNEVQWSAPEKEWLFKCLVTEINEIPEDIVGLDNLSKLRMYLSNRPDAVPGAISSTMRDVELSNPKDVIGDKAERNPGPLSIVDVSDESVEISFETEKSKTVVDIPNYKENLEYLDGAVTQPLDKSRMNNIPKIPALGEEWSDLTQLEGYDVGDGMPDLAGDFGGYDEPTPFGDIDDALIDSVGSIIGSFDTIDLQEPIDETILFKTSTMEVVAGNSSNDDIETMGGKEIVDTADKSDFVDAALVVVDNDEEITAEGKGVLDQLFMEGLEIDQIFNKYYADEDTMSLGSNEDKANWAAQDLYTILQFTSILKRVEAGRRYMRENKDNWFDTPSVDNHVAGPDDALSSDIESYTPHNTTTAISMSHDEELALYCTSQKSDGDLRSDLRRLRNLAEKKNQATERTLAMMDADFTDRSAGVRGYSWLGNVLKFNEMKVRELNDIIESKENFLHSHEGLSDLENIVNSDWNELCDPNEMWEFDKNVDLDHRSHFADLVIIDQPNRESQDDFAERSMAEWDIESLEDFDRNQEQDAEELDHDAERHELTEEFLEEHETDWSDHDV